MLDIEKGEIATFPESDFHTSKIECLRYTDIRKEYDNPGVMLKTVLSASDDRQLKIWDRGSGALVAAIKHQGQPFYSVDSNGQIIAAGTNEDLVFWDIRNFKIPIAVLQESHSDDVTGVRFCPRDYHRVVTCGADNLVNTFNFEGKASMSEEDEVCDNTYCSEQPLLDCGFLGKDKFFALTSVNTVEICNMETADMFTRVAKFPHPVDYVIST